ncbi:MAG: hypothetical protein OQK04_13835, partial [Kangiellaceae bacterium]|nr:hypothetical protein [Kangiellaceae bacterium]
MKQKTDFFESALTLLLLFSLAFTPAKATKKNNIDKSLDKYQYVDPIKTIQLIESRLNKPSQSLSNFSQWKLLIELLLKTEQFLRAEESFDKLKNNFKSSKEARPDIALLEAQIMLHNHVIDDFIKVLKPYQHELENQSNIERHIWYRYLLGSYQLRKSLYRDAMSNLTYARERAKQLKFHHLEMGICNRLAQLFYTTQRYQEALNLSDEIIEHASQIGDEFSKLNAISNKMNIYYMQAIQFAQANKVARSNTSARLSGDSELLSDNSNSGNKPGNSDWSKYQNFLDNSRKMQQQVFALSKSIKANRSMLRALIVKQNQHLSNDAYEAAISVGKEIVQLAEKYGLKYEGAVAANNIAIAAKFKGDFELSFYYLKATKDYYQSIDDLQSLSWVFEDYALTYELAKDYKRSLEYFKKYHTVAMSIANKISDQKLLELQQKFSANEKTQKIERLTQRASLNAEQLKNEKMKRWMLTTILSTLIIVALVLYRKRKRLRQLLQKEAALNQQIIEINKAKQRFFNNISHEFRTALTLSIGPLKAIFSQSELSNKETLKTVLENNLHMVSLLNEVMDIERMEAKSFPMHLTEVNIKLLVNRCVQRFKLQLTEKGIQLALEGFDRELNVIFDQ